VKRLGTRGSPLALEQARRAENYLKSSGIDVSIVVVTSKGDKDLKSPLWKLGGKGAFTRALEEALVKGEIDLAVHSAKDLPVSIAEGTEIVSVLPRGRVEDLLLVREPVEDVGEFLKQARIATGSLRRRALLRKIYGSENFVDIRGNVDTRIRKLHEGEFDALVLARAGLERLNLLGRSFWYKFDPDFFVPSPGQGFIVIQGRKGENEELKRMDENWISFHVERNVAAQLSLDCRTPAGFHAKVESGKVYFSGVILTPDGSDWVELKDEERVENWDSFHIKISEKFHALGVERILERIERWVRS